MFTLHQYINQNESPWDKFVLSSNNGTLFHLRKFLNYHPKDRFQDHSILIEKKQNLFSVLPAAELIVDSKRILVSHPGSTVGSFVVPENLSIADAMSMSEALVTYVKENNFSGNATKLNTNLTLTSKSVKGGLNIIIPNYNYSNKSLRMNISRVSNDFLSSSGYENNVTNFTIGTGFEYKQDLF